MCDHSESCNVYKGKHVLNATDSNEATAQYQQPEVATAESGSPHWKIVYIISISTAVSFILLLIVVVTLVTVCVYRYATLYSVFLTFASGASVCP